MNREIAGKIISKIRSLDMMLNEVHAELNAIPWSEERQALLRSLATVIAELDAGLLRPIARRYPDLDPDK